MFLITLIISVLLFLALNYRYKRTNYYQNSIQQVQKFVEGVPYELEIINTGSSYARFGFDYSYTRLKGFNCGLQPQSLSYDFKILKQYKSHLKKDCIILITLPDLVFGFLDFSNDNANTKYYHFLNKEFIVNYSFLKYFTRVKFPVLSAKRSLRYILKDAKNKNVYQQTNNMLSEEEVTKDAALRVEGWKKQFVLKSTITCDLSEDLKEMFDATTNLVSEMIDYCKENGFRPALIVPPTSKIINDMMSKEFMKECLYNNINKSNKQRVLVLDYLNDKRFQDFKLYINADMLNKTGREQFTKVVIADLEKIGLT